MKPLPLLFALASLAAAPASAQLSLLAHDHFDDGVLDPAWSVRHGSHVYAPIFSDRVTVYGEPCSASALLDGTPTWVSVSAGGTQAFDLSTCPPTPAQWYLLLGSMSGTQPGIPADLVVLPLNWDLYLETSLNWANGAVFQNTPGALDDAGIATAAVNLPAGLNPALEGTTLHQAFVVFSPLGPAHLASGPEPLTLVP